MTKQEIVSKISAYTGDTKKAATKALEAVVWVIKDELKDGRDFMIPDVGTLKVVTRAAKSGRNPKTGESIQIAEHKTVVFKPCKATREAVN